MEKRVVTVGLGVTTVEKVVVMKEVKLDVTVISVVLPPTVVVITLVTFDVWVRVLVITVVPVVPG